MKENLKVGDKVLVKSPYCKEKSPGTIKNIDNDRIFPFLVIYQHNGIKIEGLFARHELELMSSAQSKPDIIRCNCDNLILLRHGCQCGAFKAERQTA